MNSIDGSLDELIAPRVHALRKIFFNTISSCQGGKGHGCHLPTIIIKPERRPDLTIEEQRDRLVVACHTEGWNGFTIRIFQENYYQKSDKVWKHFDKRIALEFWAPL